jgi:TetR/AcrR family transcriptional repressor of mexJK operon
VFNRSKSVYPGIEPHIHLDHTYQYDKIIPMSMITPVPGPTISKSELNARDKQIAIIQAAEAMFLRLGFIATRMDAVANKAGVTKQTVYRYFPSKEILFAAVMEQVRGSGAEAYTFGNGALDQELMEYGKWCLGFHLHPKALGLYRLMLVEGEQRELYQTFMDTGPQRVLKPLVEFLQQRCDGLDDVPFHAQMLINMLLAPRNRLLLGNRETLDTAAQNKHVEKVVNLFLKTLDK